MANFYGSGVGFGAGGSAYVAVTGLTAGAVTKFYDTAGWPGYVGMDALSGTKVIVTYEDSTNSNYGTAQICDIAVDGTVTFGTPTVFISGGRALVGFRPTTALSTTKAIIAFRDMLDSNDAKAVVLDVSGTTITPGTAHTFNQTDSSNDFTTTAFLSSTKVICTWRPGGSGDIEKCNAIVLSISGSTVSSGTKLEYATVNYSNPYGLAGLSSTVAVSTWTESGTTQCCVLTISGTSVSAGSKVQVASSSETNHSCEMINSTTAIMVSTAGTVGTSRIITVSGTTPTPQTAFGFIGGTDVTEMGGRALQVDVLDSTTAVVTYAHRNSDTSDTSMRARLLTISGNTITGAFPDSIEIEPHPEGAAVFVGCRKLSSTRFAVMWVYNDGFMCAVDVD